MNTSIVVTAGVVVVIATIVVLISARREVDTERQRTFTRYVDSVCLLSVFVTLFGAYAALAQLCRLIVNPRHRFGGSSILDVAQNSLGGGSQSSIDGLLTQSRGISSGTNDVIWRSFVQALLIALVAGLVFAFHARQRRAMRAWNGFDTSAGARVDLAFRYAVCFVAVFVILMALGFGTYGVFRAAAPGVASSVDSATERERGIAQALSLLALAGGAFLVFRLHWSDAMQPKRPPMTAEETPLAEVDE